MRESVRNKRKLIVTAVAVIIAMLLSVTTGLLLYNPKGNLSEGITDGLLGNVADSVNLSNTTTGKTNAESKDGTEIKTENDLKSVLQSNGVGYISDSVSSIDLNWGQAGSSVVFSGTINGNGKTINLVSANDGAWPELPVQRGNGGSDQNDCGGAFVAVNKGTIKNVTFTYNNKTWKLTSRNFGTYTTGIFGKDTSHSCSTFGIVCGENYGGTIQNVRLDINNSYISLDASRPASGGRANKILLGGICGAQSGTVNNVFVNVVNSTLRVNVKNWTRVGASFEALQFGAVGGVYGMYTSQTAANNTSNLMVKADSATKFAVAHDGGNGTQTGEFSAIGAVAGFNISGVSGVVWDYQGSFEISGHAWYFQGKKYLPDDFLASKVAALTGVPTGYYSPSAARVNSNGHNSIADYYSNNLNSLENANSGPFTTGIGLNEGDAARGQIDRSAGKAKIDMALYAEKFGAIDMAFTNQKGYLNIRKTLSSTNSYDCFFRVGEADTDAICQEPIVGYASTNSNSFNYNFNIAGDKRFEIVTGKKFGQLNVLTSQTYTGNDYLTLFAAQAFPTNLKSEIDEVKQSTTVSFDKSTVKFCIDGDKTKLLTQLTYPRKAMNVVIKSNVNENFSYVDNTNRFCFAQTTLNGLKMDPANITDGIITLSGWQQEQSITVKIYSPTSNAGNIVRDGIVDRVEYRKVGDTTYKSVDVTHTAAGGFNFKIAETTTLAGANYEFIGYRNNNPVVFSKFDSNDLVVPKALPTLYIDNIAPELDESAFNFLQEQNVWYNNTQTVKFRVSDANSGVYTVKLERQEIGSTGWSLVTDNAPVDTDGMATISCDYYNYKVTVYDKAMKSVEYTFTAQIDKTAPDLKEGTEIRYYIKKLDGSTEDFTNGMSSSKSVFADITANFGPSGGRVYFEAAVDPDNEKNTKDTVAQSINNVFTAEIKSTVDTPGVKFNFTLISNARGEQLENGEYQHNSKTILGTVTILVKQETIEVLIGDINITSDNGGLTKVYDKTPYFDLDRISVRFSDEERKAKAEAILNKLGGSYNIDNFNDYIEVVSAGFYSDPDGNKPVYNANEGRDEKYYLIIQIRVDSMYDFAITNGQVQNNYYVFEANAVDADENPIQYQLNSQLKTVTNLGIEKKTINDMTVDYAEKTYWQPLPEFSVSVGVNELVRGDTNEDLKITYHTTATQKSNAGRYNVTATIDDDCLNYKLAEGVNTRGDLRIIRAIIQNIYIDGELNSITCFETPNVSAYFYDVQNNKVYLDIIYKNQDKEEVQFIPGKRAPLGKYYYVILLNEDTLVNYVNLSDPNMLIGYFNVVGDKVEEGRNFFIRDLDPNTSVIEVEFINELIDFRSLIEFETTALREKMVILYGPSEEANSDINKIGYYIVTLKILRGDDRYSPFTKVYEVRVIPTTVSATNDDLSAPVEKVPEGETPIDGVYFDNKVVNLDSTNISDELRGRLELLLTEEEIANGGVDKYFNFKYTYRVGNRVVSADSVVNAGSYGVTLVISGEKINPITISTYLNILTRRLEVKLDTAKYADIDETINVKDENGVITISKTFNGLGNKINLSLDKDFEAELQRLLGITADTPEEEYGYKFSDNDKDAAGEYNISFSLGLSINNNLSLINNTFIISIAQRVVDLEVENINTVFSGGTYLLLTENDIQALIDNGIADPYMDPDTGIAQGINTLYFGIEEYVSKGVIVIRQKPINDDPTDIVTGGKLGLYFPNSGTYNVPIRMRVRDNNFRIGNGQVSAVISKAPVNSISLDAEYIENGISVTTPVPQDGKFETEYNGHPITFKLGEQGKLDLDKLGVLETEVQFENEVVINAGTYKVSVIITNDNILSDAYVINVVINKKKIGDRVGKFDSSVWLIDGETPNAEQLETGIMYTKTEGREALYSIKLVDEEQLIAEGFSVRYLYDGKEIKGVTKAGSYKVTAEITRTDDSNNWETKIVELWKLDKNGDYVVEDVVINDGHEDGDAQVTEKRRVVEEFIVAKSDDLQAEIDSMTEFLLKDKEATYNGKPHDIDFTQEQYDEFARRNIGIVMKKNEFINAGEYTILVTFYRLSAPFVKDNNYESAEIEATLTIKPIQVKIIYEIDEKYKYDKKGLNARFNEGGEIKVTAYYLDMYGRKIEIKSFTTEVMSGSGDEIDFSAPGKDKDGNDEIYPGNYQMTANISDTNYAYDEEDVVNYFRFNIKNQTKATNTTLYILLGFLILMIVSAALICWYVLRLYNPQCQDIELDGEENY